MINNMTREALAKELRNKAEVIDAIGVMDEGEVSALLKKAAAALATAAQAQSEPLTEQRINEIWGANEVFEYYPGAVLEFVRDIESAHGITKD